MSMAICMNASGLILPFGYPTGLSPSRQLVEPEAENYEITICDSKLEWPPKTALRLHRTWRCHALGRSMQRQGHTNQHRHYAHLRLRELTARAENPVIALMEHPGNLPPQFSVERVKGDAG